MDVDARAGQLFSAPLLSHYMEWERNARTPPNWVWRKFNWVTDPPLFGYGILVWVLSGVLGFLLIYETRVGMLLFPTPSDEVEENIIHIGTSIIGGLLGYLVLVLICFVIESFAKKPGVWHQYSLSEAWGSFAEQGWWIEVRRHIHEERAKNPEAEFVLKFLYDKPNDDEVVEIILLRVSIDLSHRGDEQKQERPTPLVAVSATGAVLALAPA